MIDKHFHFEELVIDPILNTIKDNQKYLTQKPNLPQLAKLGFLYNLFWYSGRSCWGSGGSLREGALKPESERDTDDDWTEGKYYDCEDNPKYKIEACDPKNEKIENLIYDAWGMHVENNPDPITWDELLYLLKEGKKLSELDKKLLKVNKTFDEWVAIKLDPNYRYKSLYSNRRAIASNLLCTIGTGYGWNKEGFIIEEAGGADQDKSLYGDWQNATFREDIQAIVDKILEYPETKATIEQEYKRRMKYVEEKKKESQKSYDIFYDILNSAGLLKEGERGKLSRDEIYDRIDDYHEETAKKTGKTVGFSLSKSRKASAEKYHPYYPISRSSKIYAILDKETRDREGIKNIDQSYVDVSIEICKDILAHEEEENKERKENVKFAKKFLAAFGFKEYEKDVPKELDKYALEKSIHQILKPIIKAFKKNSNFNELTIGEYYYNFNDTKKSSYADNSYLFAFMVNPDEFEKGNYNTVEILKGSELYKSLKDGIKEIKKLEGVKSVLFYFDNPIKKSSYDKPMIRIEIKRFSQKEQMDFENALVKEGFQIGNFSMTYQINNLIFSASKPKTLGKSHPHNKTGAECFSHAGQFDVFDEDGKQICNFHIDERKFNILRPNHGSKTEVAKWIVSEYSKMKASDPAYGTYSDENRDNRLEGKKCLYTHDFFKWLKQNQTELA